MFHDRTILEDIILNKYGVNERYEFKRQINYNILAFIIVYIIILLILSGLGMLSSPMINLVLLLIFLLALMDLFHSGRLYITSNHILYVETNSLIKLFKKAALIDKKHISTIYKISGIKMRVEPSTLIYILVIYLLIVNALIYYLRSFSYYMTNGEALSGLLLAEQLLGLISLFFLYLAFKYIIGIHRGLLIETINNYTISIRERDDVIESIISNLLGINRVGENKG